LIVSKETGLQVFWQAIIVDADFVCGHVTLLRLPLT
jgi:hypothetical protein